MNKAYLMGRLTKDPQVSQNGDIKVARYTLAVDRKSKEKSTDFINCVTFGRGADFAENYLHQGMKIAVAGHIQTGSYTNREGKKVYTFDVVAEEHEFCEGRETAYEGRGGAKQSTVDSFTTNTRSGSGNASESVINGFVDIEPGSQEELPFT